MTDSARPFEGLALAVAAPSRQWVTNEGGIDWALRRRAFSAAEALGFRVRELEGTYLEEARFAGPDAVRAGDLTCALTELDADLVMAMRGGYGCGRILDMLDWERIGAASTPFVGFSDVTAFELALLARTGRTSWQGPTLRDLIDPDPLTIEGLLAVVGRRPFASTWQSDDTDDADAEGVLWGGNLAMIASLAGTPWMPQVENGILFIEDVAEPAYRIERMLLTLDMAGILRRQQAVVVCDLQGADRPAGWEGDFRLSHALDFMRARTGLSFVTGCPFGHLHRKLSLPVGMRVRLSSHEGRVSLEAAP